MKHAFERLRSRYVNAVERIFEFELSQKKCLNLKYKEK